MSNTVKAILINLGLFIILIILYFISGFLAGYGSNNSYEGAAWRLYIIFFLAHLGINYLLLKKLKILSSAVLISSCIVTLILYAIVALIYR